jgi:hypothetical protein
LIINSLHPIPIAGAMDFMILSEPQKTAQLIVPLQETHQGRQYWYHGVQTQLLPTRSPRSWLSDGQHGNYPRGVFLLDSTSHKATGLLPYCRHPCKSFVKLRHGCPGHARESVQVNSPRMFHTQRYASRHRFLRSAEPDIHLLSRTPKSRHRRLSLCSLPVPKQFVESLGRLISFAQSAKCRTGQSAHGSSCLFSGSL